MKILINSGAGGFGFSRIAYTALCGAEIIGTIPTDIVDIKVGSRYDDLFKVDFEFSRADPKMIKIIEELGLNVASGKYARLSIVEVPDNAKKWEIITNEYGIEFVLYGDYDYVMGQ